MKGTFVLFEREQLAMESDRPGLGKILGSAIASLTVAGALVLGGAVPPSAADPADDVSDVRSKITRVKDRIEDLEMQAAAADQKYAAAQDSLDKAESRLASQRADLAKARSQVEASRTALSRYALAQYQNSAIDPATTLLLAPGDDSFVRRYATVAKVNETQNEALQKLQTARANLADLEQAAAGDVAEVKAQTAQMAQARTESKAKVSEAEKTLASLNRQEQQALAAQERAEQAEADEAGAAAAATTSRTSRDSDRTKSDPSDSSKKSDEPEVSASGGAAAAIAFARAQIGKPYSYGSTGPNSYDCSGLTGAAWRAAGVGLPRTSQAQFGAGRSVSTSNLQPGDLVFYYSGISHVGIYVGNGMIIHASRPGKPVGYAPVNSMPLAGARRVG